MRPFLVARCFTLAVIASATVLASAQAPQKFTRVYGASDSDVPTPAHLTKAASDGPAIQQIIDFLKATGITGWKGLTGAGTITYANGSTYPARLAVLAANQCRLDVDRAEGKQSTVLSGNNGIFLPAQGKPSAVSSDIVALGLLAFPRLLSSDYPNAKSILVDQGVLTVGGKQLHRVTLDDPASDSTDNRWKTEDLYFEPGTGRLVKSTALVHLTTSDSALYLLQTNYEDYRTVNGTTLPYTFKQSLNGQPSWTLSLTTLDSQTPPAPAVFNY